MLTLHQNYVTLILAFLFGILILVSFPIWHGPDLWLRVIYAIALFLLARDVIAGAAITRGKKQFSNPDRWVYAFYHGLYFGIFMMLFNWQGPESLLRLSVAASIGAILFGGIMGFMYYGWNHAYIHHFNTQNSVSDSGVRKIIFFIWPVITISLYIALLLYGFTDIKAVFVALILIGFLMPRFSRLKKGSYVWTNFPRIVGLILVLAPTMFELSSNIQGVSQDEAPIADTTPQSIVPEL